MLRFDFAALDKGILITQQGILFKILAPVRNAGTEKDFLLKVINIRKRQPPAFSPLASELLLLPWEDGRAVFGRPGRLLLK